MSTSAVNNVAAHARSRSGRTKTVIGAGNWIRFSHTTAVQLTEQQVPEAAQEYAAHITVAEGEAVVFSTWPASEPVVTVIYVRASPSARFGRTVRNKFLGADLCRELGLGHAAEPVSPPAPEGRFS